MKKIILVLSIAFSFAACNIDDDGPGISYTYVEILDATLPAYFIVDEEYEIDITYDIGSDCNTFSSFEYNGRPHQKHDSIFEFYVNAIVSYDPNNVANCTDTGLIKTTNWTENFKLNSDQYEVIRFNFLSGTNTDHTAKYLTRDILVGEPEDTPEETTE